MKYEAKLDEFKKKLNKKGKLDYSDLQEIDEIRRYALKHRSRYLQGKYKELLLMHFDRSMTVFKDKRASKKVFSDDDLTTYVKLSHYQRRIKEDKYESLTELEMEVSRILQELEAVGNWASSSLCLNQP